MSFAFVAVSFAFEAVSFAFVAVFELPAFAEGLVVEELELGLVVQVY